MKKINSFEILFCNEYLRNGFHAQNAMLACRPELTPAGAACNATMVMKRPQVQEYLQKRQRIMEQETRVTRQFMEDELFDLLANCKNDDDRQHIIKTLDMMAKMTGMYNHKKELDVKSDGVVINFIKPDANN